MTLRILPAAITVVAAAAVVVLLHPTPIWEPATPTAAVGAFGTAHDHAHLYVMVDGDRMPLSRAYMEQDRRAHFHRDDAIIHVEATDVTLRYTLSTLDIGMNRTCIRFGPDNLTRCENAASDIRLSINGNITRLADALSHEIEQGDNIVVYHGPRNKSIPERYETKPLPDAYTRGAPGQQI